MQMTVTSNDQLRILIHARSGHGRMRGLIRRDDTHAGKPRVPARYRRVENPFPELAHLLRPEGHANEQTFPVLVAPYSLNHETVVDARIVAALDHDNKILVWELIAYTNGERRINVVYHGPNVKLATEKLNKERSTREWANWHSQHPNTPPPVPYSEPMQQEELGTALRLMRRHLRSPNSPLRSFPG